MSIWSSVIGSVALVSSGLTADLQDLWKTLTGLDYEGISKIWTGMSAVLVGGGAIGMRNSISVDKKLDGDWYWVSKVMDHSGDKILRFATGIVTISGIDNWKKREESPGDVLHGSAKKINNKDVTNSVFSASSITIARNRAIYYEWEYNGSNGSSGWTKLTWQPVTEEGLLGIIRRSGISIKGRFCMANSFGSGSIEFFRSKAEAFAEYEMLRQAADSAGGVEFIAKEETLH